MEYKQFRDFLEQLESNEYGSFTNAEISELNYKLNRIHKQVNSKLITEEKNNVLKEKKSNWNKFLGDEAFESKKI